MEICILPRERKEREEEKEEEKERVSRLIEKQQKECQATERIRHKEMSKAIFLFDEEIVDVLQVKASSKETERRERMSFSC